MIRTSERMTYRKPPKVGTAARFYYHESDDGWPVFRFIGKSLDGTTLWHGPRHLGAYFAAKCGEHIRTATRNEWRHFRDSQRNRKHWAEIWARQQFGTVPGRPSNTANPFGGIRSDATDQTGQKADMSSMSSPATASGEEDGQDNPL